jgi:hypothetical protein
VVAVAGRAAGGAANGICGSWNGAFSVSNAVSPGRRASVEGVGLAILKCADSGIQEQDVRREAM